MDDSVHFRSWRIALYEDLCEMTLMKRTAALKDSKPLILHLEHIRIIAGGDGGAAAAPEPTRGSTAPSCQSTKFACC